MNDAPDGSAPAGSEKKWKRAGVRETIAANVLLTAHLRQGKDGWLYEDGWSDERIAHEVDPEKILSAGAIARIRTELFGPIAVPVPPTSADVDDLRKRVSALEKAVDDLTGRLKALEPLHGWPFETRGVQLLGADGVTGNDGDGGSPGVIGARGDASDPFAEPVRRPDYESLDPQ